MGVGEESRVAKNCLIIMYASDMMKPFETFQTFIFNTFL